MAGRTRQSIPMESHRLDLMTRLCALDAALASRHERAITVEELCQVWDLHHVHFAGMVEGDLEWVEPLLQTIARRHGILGLVHSRAHDADREGDIIAST